MESGKQLEPVNVYVGQDLDPASKQIERSLKDAFLQAPASELPDWARCRDGAMTLQSDAPERVGFKDGHLLIPKLP